MRIEPHGVGTVTHIVKRGARGAAIVRDDADRMRFVRLLYVLNDRFQPANRHEVELHKSDLCYRPAGWPHREPLVSILAWTLMPNHFHLLLSDVAEGGTARFMQRLGGSMTVAFNQKYQETGSLFQGAYKSRNVDDEAYLRYVFSYVTVKNVMELFPGGLPAALRDYRTAWQWALSYQYSSLHDHVSGNQSPILDVAKLQELDLPGPRYKEAGRDMLVGHANLQEGQDTQSPLPLEDW